MQVLHGTDGFTFPLIDAGILTSSFLGVELSKLLATGRAQNRNWRTSEIPVVLAGGTHTDTVGSQSHW